MDSNLTSVRGGDSDSPKDVVKLSRMMLRQGRLYRCGLVLPQEVCWLRRACDRHDAKSALKKNDGSEMELRCICYPVWASSIR
eukprot:scaffold5385_cov207-Skeletonema_dohrnii-CCMP3373.AAC.2